MKRPLIPTPGACPFCGNKQTQISNQDGFTRVECPPCGAAGPVYGDELTEYADRARQAVSAWNKAARRR